MQDISTTPSYPYQQHRPGNGAEMSELKNPCCDCIESAFDTKCRCMDKMQYDRKQREIKDNMLKAILEYRKRFSPVDQHETLDRIDWIYEELRSIPD